MQARERRYRIYSVSEIILEGFFSALLDRPGFIRLPLLRGDGIPADAVIDGVQYDFHSRTFSVRLWHASFPVVPDCEPIPSFGGLDVEYVSVPIDRARLDQAIEAVVLGLGIPQLTLDGKPFPGTEPSLPPPSPPRSKIARMSGLRPVNVPMSQSEPRPVYVATWQLCDECGEDLSPDEVIDRQTTCRDCQKYRC